ncbi:MAG: DEAD/DEAH box helicase [Planctomycetes bacterium]|nr:DEAD/DEAH box helicase [Planctomycetota bacterium]
MKFTDLDLKPEILAALKEIKYVDLTPIQEKTFPHILAGKDIIARAETGSGKTAACGIPLVQMVDQSIKAVQSLILVPTRELALQYVSEISDIARKIDVKPFAVYGGFPIQTQIAKLNHGVDILVATPGRLIDLLSNTPLSLSEVRTFVLDEADEMLNMGFISDVEFVFSCLIHKHQSLMFSATMPKKVEILAKRYLNDPLTIYMSKEKQAPQSLKHHFLQTSSHHRLEALLGFLEKAKPKQVIIFCNSRTGAEKLYKHLRDTKRPSTEIIHGGLEQSKRTSLFRRFRRMDITTMIATDLASRGLDFAHATHVINYDFPKFAEAYTHRTGRTARMGRKGVALTLFTKSDLHLLKTVINGNDIKPVWEGTEPNLDNLPKQKPNKFYGRKNKGRRRR